MFATSSDDLRLIADHFGGDAIGVLRENLPCRHRRP